VLAQKFCCGDHALAFLKLIKINQLLIKRILMFGVMLFIAAASGHYAGLANKRDRYDGQR
jgi:hypothetical protein